jgi:branched-chain amino acid transport system ATP-binding protein
MTLLEIRNLSKYFGGLAAVNGVDMDVHDSEILGLIGPNGAGKSTLFNLVNGTDRPSSGKITFKGNDVTGLSTHRIAKMGIGRTFQATTLFMNETVLDNAVTGFHLRYKTRPWKAFLHTRSCRHEDKAYKIQAAEILDFMGLLSQKSELARNLPHGHQRILGICLALATNPSLLLLDEPATGMHPEEMNNLVRLIKKLRDGGITIVVVEHHMQAVMSLCDRLVVLNFGKKIAEGIPEEIRKNEEVIEAYLGTD